MNQVLLRINIAEDWIYLIIFRESRSYLRVILSEAAYWSTVMTTEGVLSLLCKERILIPSHKNPTKINNIVDFPSTIAVTLNRTEAGNYIINYLKFLCLQRKVQS